MWSLVAAICGLALPGWLPALPDSLPLWLAALAGLLLFPAGRPMTGAFLLGFFWAASWGEARLAARLPEALHGKSFLVEGEIVSLPNAGEHGTSFILRAGHTEPPTRVRRLRLTLNSPLAKRLQPGQTWRFCVRLRLPRGQVNPLGASRAAWLLRQGLAAEGRVLKNCPPEQLRASASLSGLLHRQRQLLRQELQQRALLHDGLLAALMTGDGSGLADEQWQLLQRTGTLHLFIISGLHMTLVAGLGGLIGTALQRALAVLPCTRLLPLSRLLPFSCALLFISCYALLAGGGLSVQRAWVSLVCALVMLNLKRRPAAWRLLLASMLLVLMLDPLAVQFAGFWLSFGAVAALLYQFHERYGGRGLPGLPGRLLLLIRIEFALLLLLGAALAFWTGEWPLLSVAANLLAMPLVSFLLVPLLLLTSLDLLPASPFGYSNLLLPALDLLLHVILYYLELLAEATPDFFSRLQGITLPRILLALAACWLLALPSRFPMRCLGLLLLPWLLLPQPAGPELELVVFDVGQGTAVSLRTRRQLALYDLGPQGGFHWNLLPWLRSQPRKPGYLILSHGDADHAGAFPEARRRYPDAEVITGPATAAQLQLDRYIDCSAGRQLELDGVQLRFLPSPQGGSNRRRSDNEDSCVLHVASSRFGLLLTGDIGHARETSLLRQLPELPTDLLLVPHHGSHTSSSPAFLNALMPQHALVSAGFDNRFGHPRPHIVKRYEARGAQLSNTALSGALLVTINGPELRIRAARSRHPRYWDN